MKRALLALAIGAPLMAQVKLPPYTREALPNGAAVYYMRKTGLPLVSFRVLVKGGAESDPASLAGLSGLTAELLRRGAGRLSAAQFADEVAGLGGTFNAATDDQASIITAEFLERDFQRGLAFVADAVLRPTFPEDEVSKALARRGDQLRAAKDNPAVAIPSYYRSFFFGAGHPYGRVPDEASFGRMRRQDILDYHRLMYGGRNLIIMVAGAFDPAQARSAVASAFGAAPAGTAYQWAEDRPAAPAASARLLLVDKPDATQTYFVIAQPGLRRTAPDRVALNLVNTLVGGRFTSMLNQELRVASGLTYGANSRVDLNRLTGAIAVNTYTRTDATGRAIDLALAVLKRVQESGITAEQLASAKAYVKGTFAPTRVQTADQIAAVLGEMELFGLGRGEVDDFLANVDAVTLDEANAVARRYYKPANLTFVLLGSAAKIRESAAKYAPKMVERPVTAPGWAAQ